MIKIRPKARPWSKVKPTTCTLEAIETHFSTVPETKLSQFESNDKGHGRIENRRYLGANSDEILDLKDWPGLSSAIKVVSTRDISGIASTETRFYITSMEYSEIERIGLAARGHWGVENGLHHVLDVTFDQDKSRIRKDKTNRKLKLETSLRCQLPSARFFR